MPTYWEAISKARLRPEHTSMLRTARTELDWAWSMRLESADSATNFWPNSFVMPKVDIWVSIAVISAAWAAKLVASDCT